MTSKYFRPANDLTVQISIILHPRLEFFSLSVIFKTINVCTVYKQINDEEKIEEVYDLIVLPVVNNKSVKSGGVFMRYKTWEYRE